MGVNQAIIYYWSTVGSNKNIAPCKTISLEGQSFVI
jgi:hypothetical protein